MSVYRQSPSVLSLAIKCVDEKTIHLLHSIHIRSPLLDQNLNDLLVASLCSDMKWRPSILCIHNNNIIRSINKEEERVASIIVSSVASTECVRRYNEETTHILRSIHIRSSILDQNLNKVLVAIQCSNVKRCCSILYFLQQHYHQKHPQRRGACIVNHRQFFLWPSNVLRSAMRRQFTFFGASTFALLSLIRTSTTSLRPHPTAT